MEHFQFLKIIFSGNSIFTKNLLFLTDALNSTSYSKKIFNLSFKLFNHDIGKWNVSKATNIESMFQNSSYSFNNETWNLIKCTKKDTVFKNTPVEKENRLPYWFEVDVQFLPQAIKAYNLNQNLNKKLKKFISDRHILVE